MSDSRVGGRADGLDPLTLYSGTNVSLHLIVSVADGPPRKEFGSPKLTGQGRILSDRQAKCYQINIKFITFKRQRAGWERGIA